MKKSILYTIFLLMLTLSTRAQSQSFTLEKCLDLTQQNSQIIKQADMELAQSEQISREAFTHYFPSVSASGLAMKANDYMIKGVIPEMNLPIYDGNLANLSGASQFAYFPGMQLGVLDYVNTASVTITQPVFAGLQVTNGNRLARVGNSIAVEKARLTTRDQLLSTEKYYWMLAGLIQQRETIASYKKLLVSLKNDVSVSYHNGLIQKSDLLKVELSLNQVDVNSMELENGIEAVQRALCQQIGVEYDNALVPADTNLSLLAPDHYYVSPDSALTLRPEYQIMLKVAEVATLQKKLARGKILPTVAVGATGFWFDAVDNTATNAMAFASVSIPISDWWGGSHQIRHKSIEIEKANSQLTDNMEKLIMQQIVAYNKLKESWSRVGLSQVAFNEATEHLRVVADNRNAGVVGVSDLLEAQLMWQNASQQNAAARYTYLAEVASYKSISSTIK